MRTMKTKFQKRCLAIAIICFILAGIVLLIFLNGCGGSGEDNLVIVTGDYYITALGLSVHIPDSIFSNYLWTRSYIFIQKQNILDTILYWTDYRVTECALKHPDRPDTLDVARKITYYLKDDYAFKCGISYTGLCAGATDMKSYIEAPIYGRWGNDYYPNFQTAPHLVRTKEQMAVWAGNHIWITDGWNYYASDITDYGLPAICHELEHVLYGAIYGHTMQAVTKHITVFGVKE